PKVNTKNVTYPAGEGTQKARVYTPDGAKGPLPVILYIHGGGWVIADIDVYDSSPRALATAANAIVVSIEYRHAPEAKFPAAHDDANAAYKWVLADAAKWGGDPARIAIVGESAGGNMAVNVAQFARDNALAAPKHVVAVYPVANTGDTPAKATYADAKPLNKPMLDWFFKHTLASPDQATDPRLNLITSKLNGLPPTTIILAEIDPLHDDGTSLADAIKAAGGQVELKEYAGVTHEFFGMGAVVADAKAAVDFAGGKLKDALK
ncbi:MAG: alpha/beta hydrolase, partial [Sphingomonadales bacterium]